jgi:glucose-6-phosphate isomerase
VKELLTVDIGHLLGEDYDFETHILKYGSVFRELQNSLKENKFVLNLSFSNGNSLERIKALARDLKAKFTDILLLGIGGSALGFKAVLQFLQGPFYNLEKDKSPRIFVLDNLDPFVMKKLDDLLDFKKTGLIYVSKSGSTPETAASFLHYFKMYKDFGGKPEDIVIICDHRENGINRIAGTLGCHLLHIPQELPGRYSVLSPAGFLPAEIIDVDSRQLLEGAQAANQSIIKTGLEQNALFMLGTSIFEHTTASGKSMHVLFNYSNLLSEFGLWFMQLWAESLGKKLSLTGETINAGATPLSCLGATDQHSLLQLFKEGPDDKVYGFIKIDNFPGDIALTGEFPTEKEYSYFSGHTVAEQLHIEQMSTEMSLIKAGRPCYRITLKDISAPTLGALFYFYEALVVYIARLLRVNPFDQPGVEEGKNITYSLMGRADYAHRREEYAKEIKLYNNKSKLLSI